MTLLEQLRGLIDEENYPYFTDAYLQARIDALGDALDINLLAKELCLVKSGIEEMKLGDITIPSPKQHFISLAKQYRTNQTRAKVRADGM